MRIAPASLFLYGPEKRKKHGPSPTFPRSGHFFQPWSNSTNDLALMVLYASWFGIWQILTWAQVSEGSGAGLAKGYVFAALYPSRLSCSFGLLWTAPILNWWLGIDLLTTGPSCLVLVAMFLLFAAMISEVFKAAYLAIPRSGGSGLGIS